MAQSQLVVKDNVFVYFVNMKGDIIPAPDTRVSLKQLAIKGWRRVEAVGAKEIERVSLIMSRQMHERQKQTTAAQHLREQARMNEKKVSCRLRIAQAFSAEDVYANNLVLRKLQDRENRMMKFIVGQFDPSARTSGLEMEMKPESTAPIGAQIDRKRAGIA